MVTEEPEERTAVAVIPDGAPPLITRASTVTPEPKEWTALGVSAAWAAPRVLISVTPHFAFRGVYLIVHSPGWFLHRVLVGVRICLMDVPGDTYLREEHDRLERLGQLERHRLSLSTAGVGQVLQFEVSAQCTPVICGESEAALAALGALGCRHPRLPFSATVIGVRVP